MVVCKLEFDESVNALSYIIGIGWMQGILKEWSRWITLFGKFALLVKWDEWSFQEAIKEKGSNKTVPYFKKNIYTFFFIKKG